MFWFFIVLIKMENVSLCIPLRVLNIQDISGSFKEIFL